MNAGGTDSVPMEAGEAAAVRPDSTAAVERSPQILLVEDECALRDLLLSFLESRGYAVHAEKNGRLAAQWLAKNRADAVLTDLCMPDADGLELLMELRKRPTRPPVIAMSGGIDGDAESLLRMATMLGAKKTLPKPFPLEDLARAVSELTS